MAGFMGMTLGELAGRLVVHTPHAGLSIPTSVRQQFTLSDTELAIEAHGSADLWTDALAQSAWPAATHITVAVSRLVVDVERYPDDAQEEMARVGRGAVYTRAHDGAALRRPLSIGERDALIASYHTPHWAKLREAASGKVLVDLHSYPVKAWPIELNVDADRPAIDLGTDDAITPSVWSQALQRHFESAGYTVGFNTPYAGVIDAGAAVAVMIEIRRDVLGTGPGSPEYQRLAEALQRAPAPDLNR
jgi:N-formylglutamate amidohydrolase